MSTKKIVVCEYAPARSDGFRRWLQDPVILKRYDGDRIPASFDLIIFGGGPMSARADDRERHPFLQEDFDFIEQELQPRESNGPKMVGICLGAQLLTLSLGGEVVEGPMISGWNPIEPIGNHAIYPRETRVVQFEHHRNHITALPPGATHLARSYEDEIEAFLLGSRILATAYHPEVTKDIAEKIYAITGRTVSEHERAMFDRQAEEAEEASRVFFEGLLL